MWNHRGERVCISVIINGNINYFIWLFFRNGSKQMEFLITAELKGRTSWSAFQDITGRIQRGLEHKKIAAKGFVSRSLLVQGTKSNPLHFVLRYFFPDIP